MDQSRGVPDGTESNSDPTASSTPNTSASTTSSSNVTTDTTTNLINNWKPNDTFLTNLTLMGFHPVVAKKALFYSNNESAEAAIEWIFNHGDDLDLSLEMEIQAHNQQSTITASNQSSLVMPDACDDLYKMVFVVNSELLMGIGKIAAQVAHAALGLHRLLLQQQNKYGEPLLSWTEYGETKIVLRGNDTNHLVELEHQAIRLDLPCYMVHDAGKTQVKSGSTTVLGIFGSNKLVDQVTGQLKLY